jgi:N-methylhydantoinase B
VRQDVIDGYVTREGAQRDYGVVLRDDSTVDEDATNRVRAFS